MSLARKYRARFGTPRGDRLLLYFTTALALHAGAATAGFMSWQEWQTNQPTEAIASTPIEFVYVDADDTDSQNATRRAQSNAKAQGTHQPNLPVNAGKATVAPQKATLPDAPKPVDAATLNIPGEVRPAQNAVAPTARPSTPTEEAKAVTAAPAPTAPPLVSQPLAIPIPTLPSTVAPAPVPPVSLEDPTAQPFPLPEPPQVPSPQAVPETDPPEAIASPAPPKDAVPGSINQPIAATTGLAGVPNSGDRPERDGPMQIAAQQDGLRGDYVAQAIAEITQQWEQISVHVNENHQAVVHFEINRLGNLMQINLAQTSGSAEADQAALDAVRNAAPFPAFTDEMTDERLGINMTFNYTISNNAPSSPMPSTREDAPTASPHPQLE